MGSVAKVNEALCHCRVLQRFSAVSWLLLASRMPQPQSGSTMLWVPLIKEPRFCSEPRWRSQRCREPAGDPAEQFICGAAAKVGGAPSGSCWIITVESATSTNVLFKEHQRRLIKDGNVGNIAECRCFPYLQWGILSTGGALII